MNVFYGGGNLLSASSFEPSEQSAALEITAQAALESHLGWKRGKEIG